MTIQNETCFDKAYCFQWKSKTKQTEKKKKKKKKKKDKSYMVSMNLSNTMIEASPLIQAQCIKNK